MTAAVILERVVHFFQNKLHKNLGTENADAENNKAKYKKGGTKADS